MGLIFPSETLNCLAAMNEARTAAGLAEFKPAAEQGQMLPENPAAKSDIQAAELWEEICQEIAGVSRVMSALLSRVLVHSAKQSHADYGACRKR